MTTAPICSSDHVAGNVTVSLNNDPRLTRTGTYLAHCDVCGDEWSFDTTPVRDERLGRANVT